MFQGPANRKIFVVTCKRCRRDVPTGLSEFPFQSVTVVCCLCGETRRYLPSETFLGRVDHLVVHQRKAGNEGTRERGIREQKTGTRNREQVRRSACDEGLMPAGREKRKDLLAGGIDGEAVARA